MGRVIISRVKALTLETPLYSMSEAARFLHIPPQTLRRWLQGAKVSNKTYPPVIRQEPRGDDAITWAEFVEAGLLREYRTKKVSLQHMRPLIEGLRGELGVPYPLAHFRPLVDVSKKRLVFELQENIGLNEELFLIRRPDESGQLQWAASMQMFLEKVDFDPDGIADRMHPFGRRFPVVIDPEVVFGIPQVKGVRTETMFEAFATGEQPSAIARSWSLSNEEVIAALQWEAHIGRRAA